MQTFQASDDQISVGIEGKRIAHRPEKDVEMDHIMVMVLVRHKNKIKISEFWSAKPNIDANTCRGCPNCQPGPRSLLKRLQKVTSDCLDDERVTSHTLVTRSRST